MPELTIAGQTFTVEPRYGEGHELTAGEASALNQTFFENIRNNMAKKVKDALEAGSFDASAFQQQITEYAGEYQFGIRSSSGPRDPVMSEAMNLARAKIRELLKKSGKKADAEAVSAAAEKLLASPKGEPIMALARQRVEEAQALAADQLDDLISSIPEKAPEAPVEA